VIYLHKHIHERALDVKEIMLKRKANGYGHEEGLRKTSLVLLNLPLQS